MLFVEIWVRTQEEHWEQTHYTQQMRDRRRTFLCRMACARLPAQLLEETYALIDGWHWRVSIGEPGDGWRVRFIGKRFRLYAPDDVM